ncbi:PKD domain-containing protein [Kitasatospora sp. NPDC049285]|uniref:PKD domain-containing protein n=1 Tax=Kitasatospora sp. NPDC049285 TaxID=3157096 RepID=UPI0034262A58
MRTNRASVLSVACITGILGLAVPASASAADATIYVNPVAARCSDSGTGTQALPFCTLTAAADSAQPDQTVQVAPGAPLNEAVRITKSGLPGHPITIKGSDDFPSQPEIDAVGGQPALTLSGVHDVVIDGLYASGSATSGPIVVKDSSRVLLDHLDVGEAPQSSAGAGVLITGQGDHVTLSRSYLEATHGIVVDPLVGNTTIAGNDLPGSLAGAIHVAAPGAVVTNNTVSAGTGPGISLLGAATDATVENNIVVDATSAPSSTGSPDAQIAVSAGSVTRTKVDYNIVHAPAGHPDYNWAGTALAGVADFRATSQQGAHDVDSAIVFDRTVLFGDRLTDADTAALKSADPNAPGVPATDLLGYGPTDDPKVPTPADGNLLDRGAYQLQGLKRAELSATGRYRTPQGPAPFTATFSATVTNDWPTKLTYTYDFGDGTTQTGDQPTTTHVYGTPGKYHPTVTVTDGVGGKVTSEPYQDVTVAPADATLQPSFTVKPWSSPMRYNLDASASSGPYKITTYVIDWNDGSTPTTDSSGVFLQHTFPQPGTYAVTLTVTDESGAKATTVQQVTTAYDPAGYVALTPTRILDTRWSASGPAPLGPGATTVVQAAGGSGPNAVPIGATAVVVNLTATQGTDDSFLTAFPTGTKVPTASNVNFKPGQDVSNVVTIPMTADGTISLYNHVGTVHVVADVLGYYKPAAGSNYTPATPTRLLDTRTTNSPLGQFGVRSLQVAGASAIPANATAVALNVTATEGTADSFLTVYPTGAQLPNASNVNFKAGTDTGNQVIVPVGQGGSIDIYNHIGSVHAVVDVFGYYSPDSKGKFIPVSPQRLMDTRQPGRHALTPNSSISVGGVPANATAAVLNVTAVDGTADSFLTVHATTTPRPATSNLNFGPGRTIPNQVITPVSNGSFDVYNHVGTTNVITDLFGYFTAG